MENYIKFKLAGTSENAFMAIRDTADELRKGDEWESKPVIDGDDYSLYFEYFEVSSLYNIEDDKIAEILLENTMSNKGRVEMLITNKERDKFRYILSGTKKILEDKLINKKITTEKQLFEEGIKFVNFFESRDLEFDEIRALIEAEF